MNVVQLFDEFSSEALTSWGENSSKCMFCSESCGLDCKFETSGIDL